MISKKWKSSIILSGIFLFFLVQKTSAASLEIKYDQQAFTAPASLRLATSTEDAKLPKDWQAALVVDYSFETEGLYDPSYILTGSIYYQKGNNDLKKLFVFDELSAVWRPLNFKDDEKNGRIDFSLKAVSGRLALISKPGVIFRGQASWYRYKGGLFAASPDFTKGSVLRVYNLDNGKSVDVVINDFGPERDKHPDRVVDLDAEAFKKIASLGAGIIPVRIELIRGDFVNKEEILLPGKEPEIKSVAASILIQGQDDLLWGKSADATRPLASLTKLLAAKVFLETKPDLNRYFAYQDQDSDYNHKYCRAGEEARLRLTAGEMLKLQDYLYASLVGSANNTVETLVRASGLSRQEFINKMNSLAISYGAVNTKFVEPTGLSPENVSSAADYAIIMNKIAGDDLIKKISSTARYSFKTKAGRQITVSNTNQLLKVDGSQIIVSKTGYLDEAGYCLATLSKSGDKNILVVTLGASSREESYSDNQKLLKYALLLLEK